MTKPTRATPESGSTPLSSRVDPILTPAKAEREAVRRHVGHAQADRYQGDSERIRRNAGTVRTQERFRHALPSDASWQDQTTGADHQNRRAIRRAARPDSGQNAPHVRGARPHVRQSGPDSVDALRDSAAKLLRRTRQTARRRRPDAVFHGVGCACRRIRASRRRGVRAYRPQAVGLCFTGASASRHAENRRRCGH